MEFLEHYLMDKFVEKGFTLVEILVALAIAGALVAIAIPSYKFYVARTQAAESLKAATVQSFVVGQNLQRGRCTTVAGVDDVYPNRFGTLTISGTKVISKGENCPSGCIATFKFNNTTEKNLHDKEIVFNILNNQKVSFVSSSVNSRYLSKDLKTISKTATDNCTALPNQPLVTTGSTPPGGSSTNPTPTNPTPTNPTPTNPTNPSDPTNSTDPTNPTNPTNPTDPTNPGNGGEVIVSKKIDTFSSNTNLSNYYPASPVFQVNHDTPPFASVTFYHRRDSSIKESLEAFLPVDTPAEAKYVVIKITLQNGKKFEMTLRDKETYGVKKVFYYKISHDYACGNASNCWNSLVANDNRKYAANPYVPMHLATDNFFDANVPYMVMPVNTPIPLSHRVPTVLEYTMYK